MVPKGLRTWFVIHFWADIIFAVPLLVAPDLTLRTFGWTCVDPVSARLVGAALAGIGIQSLIGRCESAETFRAMLNLKVIWSASAVAGLAASLAQGAPPMTWAFLVIFVVFSARWITYRLMLRRASAPAAVPG